MKTIYKALIAFLAITMLVSTVSADCGLTAYERNVVLEELPSNEIPYDDVAEKVKSKLKQASEERQADIIRNIEHPNVEQPVIPRPIPEQRTMMDDILETYTPNQPTQNGIEVTDWIVQEYEVTL